MERRGATGRRGVDDPGLASVSLALEHDRLLPEWPILWAGCWRRIRVWRRPPHWSAGDWLEEMHAEAVAAAWQAGCDYDPSRGVPLSAFVHVRVLSSALKRCRQEWSYAKHCPPEGNAEAHERGTEAWPSIAQAHEALQASVARLGEPDRWLVKHLFWDESTETEVASLLGVSQQAVSKRKRCVLNVLQRSIGASGRDED
jgi:DNA-directed RNA polymerase specialized sigma24 family protein